jgi:hypothetical protein
LLKKFTLQPGVVRDGTQYSTQGGWWATQWVRFHMSIVEMMNGFQRISDKPDPTINPNPTPATLMYQGTARSLFAWTALDGTPLLACGTTTNYYIDAQGYVFDVTPVGLPGGTTGGVYGNGYGVAPYGYYGYGTPALGPVAPVDFSQRLWSQANWGQDLFVCDKDMPAGLYYWTYSAAQFAPGTSTPAKPNVLAPLSSISTDCPYVGRMVFVTDDRHAVVLGATPHGSPNQDLMNVAWSDVENIAVWTPSDTNEAGSYRLSFGSFIVSGKPTRSENLIWTDRALYSMKYTGAPYIFGFFLVAGNVSIAGMNAAVDNGSTTFWMGQGEFYAYNGAAEILPCPIRDYIFQNINYTYAMKFFGGLNRAYAEIWWFYCSATATEIDSYVCFNWVENTWYFGKIARTAWLDPAIGRLPVATNAGLIYNHEFGMDADGQNLDCYAESSDLDLSDGQHFVYCHRAMPDVQFMSPQAPSNPNPNPAVTVTVTFKRAPNSAPPLKTVSAQYLKSGSMIYIRGRGRAASFRVESNTTGQFWRIGNMRFDIQPDGRR